MWKMFCFYRRKARQYLLQCKFHVVLSGRWTHGTADMGQNTWECILCLWAGKENMNFSDLRMRQGGLRWRKGGASQPPLQWRENGVLRTSSNTESLIFPFNPQYQASLPAPGVAEVPSTAVAQAKQDGGCDHSAVPADLWSELPTSAA